MLGIFPSKIKSQKKVNKFVNTVKPLFKGAVNRPLNRGNPLNGGNLCTSMKIGQQIFVS